MINERQLIEIAVSDVARRDPGAMERARSLLQAQMREAPPARSPRRILHARWLVAAAVVAAVVLAIRVILPGRESAAKELHRLEAIDASRVPIDISGGGYLYTRSETSVMTRYKLPNGSFDFIVRKRIETWRKADGSGLKIESISNVEFPTAADRAASEAAGELSIPEPGVRTTRYDPGELVDLSSLSTDPGELETQLRSGQVLGLDGETTSLAEAIQVVLTQGDASPALRGALFQIMAGLPDIRLVGQQTDNVGRDGIALSFTDGAHEYTYIFDPATAELLEYKVLLHLNGATTTMSWLDPTAAAVVDAAGERP